MSSERKPVWVAFPTIPWGSMGWRMGHGEDYWHAWVPWFKGLSVDVREQYKLTWPEPEGWQGFYEFIEAGKNPPWFLERQRRFAEAAIPPAANEAVISDYYRIIWLVRQHMKRSGSDQLKPEEAFAEFYQAPDGSRWRVSAQLKGGMSMHRVTA
ncbi:hypothetical protein [Dyella sp. C11]|uniref:hypothetical protein n=1 Tax=Dyella sp. C11 TaxID=2126991 RepID=UPI00130058A3|nr:hypothetical protein [Dyella sp. C11]